MYAIFLLVVGVSATSILDTGLQAKFKSDSGEGAYLSIVSRDFGEMLEANRMKPDTASNFKVFYNEDDDTYSFLAHNGHWLKQIIRGGVETVQANKPRIDDLFSRFFVNMHEDKTISLTAKSNGHYWTHFSNSKNHTIRIIKKPYPDYYSRFKTTFLKRT